MDKQKEVYTQPEKFSGRGGVTSPGHGPCNETRACHIKQTMSQETLAQT
jgi:hypothetical protein